VSINLVPYSKTHASLWDHWCESAGNATLLHTRNFLSYHNERFDDASVLIFESDRLVGIMPAARDLKTPELVISHPGATYGGMVHNGWLSGIRMIDAFEKLKIYYRECDYKKMQYKPLPHIYARVPSQDDIYALFRLGAQLTRCDLSCAIDLSARRAPSERRRRGLKKGLKTVTLVCGGEQLVALWGVLTKNLEQKHGASPVHSLAELSLLIAKFPRNIQVLTATVKGKVEAGIILFNSSNVWHAQYIASSEVGYDLSALDAVFESAINEACNVGARYFDFGTSNLQNGYVLNDGLYRFKSEFGGGGVAHEHYELVL
jgi:Acetyltransferase (GNAT) domain